MEEAHDLATLFAHAARGDGAAQAQLVHQFADLVYSVILREHVPEQDREDIFQGTFLSFFKWLGRITKPDKIPSWLMTTTQRLCWRRATHPAFDRLEGNAPLRDRNAHDPHAEAVRIEQTRALVRGLAELNPRCRRLLHALYREERSYDWIATELRMPQGAIGPTRARCLRTLRRLLNQPDRAPQDDGP